MSLENEARAATETRLDTWKSIADYLGRSARTVQRWHTQYGLPVHHLGADTSSVYAYRDELDRWLRNRDLRNEDGSSGSPSTLASEKHSSSPDVNLELGSVAEERATQLVLSAQRSWENLSSSNLSAITRMYRQAIDLNPMNAMAFAGLSQSLIAQAVLGNLHPTGAFCAAAAALERALEIDPNLFEAQCASAIMKIFVQRDWDGARLLLTETQRMRPGASQALVGWALLEIAQGRLDEAADVLRRASIARPLNTSVAELSCWVEYLSGRIESALELIAQTRESGHGGAILDTVDALCGVALGDVKSLIPTLECAVAKSPRNYSLLGVLGFAYGNTGKTSTARTLIESMSHTGLTGVHDFAYAIALTYLGIGEREEARRWLAQSFQHGSLWSLGFASDPLIANLWKEECAESVSGLFRVSVSSADQGDSPGRNWNSGMRAGRLQFST